MVEAGDGNDNLVTDKLDIGIYLPINVYETKMYHCTVTKIFHISSQVQSN